MPTSKTEQQPTLVYSEEHPQDKAPTAIIVAIDAAKGSDTSAYFYGYDEEGLAIYRGVSL